ncbi:MAG: hypothetical protein PF904_01720 [Kiritimatiellae bacterium]|nr:hypothetical protein [Kiritimatiellia bacterium]
MKLIGPAVLACDATGNLKSRIGTVFLKTPGIVTLGPMHILQRQTWIDTLNSDRKEEGKPPLTPEEEQDEMELSVDLLFDNEDKVVQIRPDPEEMDMAFLADEMLQEVISKKKIVYLNIDNCQVRNKLMMKGECWRMGQLSSDPIQMNLLLSNSRISINNFPLYFYNKNTGTRFLTLYSFKSIGRMPDNEFREQILEVAANTQKKNYHGRPEIDIFPPDCEFKNSAFESIDNSDITTEELRREYKILLAQFTQAVPYGLKIENVENIEWRNLLFETVTQSRKSKSTCEILNNISPEFYKQIQWLPGATITEDNELLFDKVFDEAKNNPNDPVLAEICDSRAKEFIMNYLRQYHNIEYINIGRISRSLSKSRAFDSTIRSNVYIVHFKSSDKDRTSLRIIRFQKWCIYEHLEKGKNLIDSIFEAVNYTDYIFNRRLACTQLGMHLPKKFFTSRIRETYKGSNPDPEAYGKRLWVVYFERDYVNGIASDKLPCKHYESEEFCTKLATLLGTAAAINIIVGRASKNGRPLFDDGDEVIDIDKDSGMPIELTVSDHTGTFNNYKKSLFESASFYASFIMNHASKIDNPDIFIDAFLKAFKVKFEWTQREYAKRQRAFDRLFIDLPLDAAGSLAYRWTLILERMQTTNVDDLIDAIRNHLKELRSI